jgi:transposase
MDIMYERCCGLDVHKQTVVACVLLPGSGRQPAKEIRTFGTMTADLLELGDWLTANGVTHVALESTGVYWHPVWNLLEGQVELLLVNAQHIKQVPGRKTDVRDCEWIANLLRHGLLRASFVPERPQRELRALTRYRTSLIRERAAEINRIQKTLEGANIKLGDVASDILGVSARRMLEALIDGATDPAVLADLAVDKLRKKLPQTGARIEGRVRRASPLLASPAVGAPGRTRRTNRSSGQRNSRAGTARRAGGGAGGRDPWVRSADGRDCGSGDRHRPQPVPVIQTSGVVGGSVSRQQ